VPPAVEGIPRRELRQGLEQPLQGGRQSLVPGVGQFTRPQLALALAEDALALAQRNGALEAEVRDLKQGFEAIEERARYELGLIKQDEIFFQVVRPAKAP